MEILYYIFLFIFWTLFWSFSSVLIDRIKKNKKWMLTWRSMCPNCNHILWFKDLIPILSFIKNYWKCVYCSKKISYIYPILEISMWFLFILTSYFLIDLNQIFALNVIEIYKLLFFLLFIFLTLVYVVYDIKFLEIPDSILFILIFITFITISLQSIIPNFHIIPTLPDYNTFLTLPEIWWLVFIWILIIIWLYMIMLKWLSELMDFLILSILIFLWVLTKFYFLIDLEKTAIWLSIIWVLIIFLFFFLQIVLSKWRWMWWWDLRIAILIWLLVWINFILPSLLITYFVWSIVWVMIIVYIKTKLHLKNKNSLRYKIKKILWIKEKQIINTQIPFWPFLAIWIVSVLFFREYIELAIKNYL